MRLRLLLVLTLASLVKTNRYEFRLPQVLNFLKRARCYRLIKSEITYFQKGLLGLYLGKKKRLRHLSSRNIYAHVNIENPSKN